MKDEMALTRTRVPDRALYAPPDKSDMSDMSDTVVAGSVGLQTLVCGNVKKVSIGFLFAHAHSERVARERAARMGATSCRKPRR